MLVKSPEGVFFLFFWSGGVLLRPTDGPIWVVLNPFSHCRLNRNSYLQESATVCAAVEGLYRQKRFEWYRRGAMAFRPFFSRTEKVTNTQQGVPGKIGSGESLPKIYLLDSSTPGAVLEKTSDEERSHPSLPVRTGNAPHGNPFITGTRFFGDKLLGSSLGFVFPAVKQKVLRSRGGLDALPRSDEVSHLSRTDPFVHPASISYY